VRSNLAAAPVLTRPELGSTALPSASTCASARPEPASEGRGLVSTNARAILVVESDEVAANKLVKQLTNDGYRVELARSAEHARTQAGWSPPRLILIGGLPCAHGPLALLKEIRQAASGSPLWAPAVPIIVIGASVSQLDTLRAFEAGADDFLSHRARYLELRARIRALLRRIELESTAVDRLTVGALEIDTSGHVVRVGGLPVRLRRLEFELLVQLASEPERVFTKQQLLRAVWGYRSCGSTRTVDSHASRLRRKLERFGGRWVINEWGVGYRLR
jgi:DNA-binding response OmpR family regulator